MEKNVGSTDKIIRYTLAVVFLALGFTVHWGFYIAALAAALTGALGFCGLYKLIGVNTCKIK